MPDRLGTTSADGGVAVDDGGDRWRRPLPPLRISAPGAFAAAAILGVGLFVYAISDTLGVFIVGLLLAFVLTPLVNWMAAHRVPRGLATLIAMVLLGVAVAVFSLLVLTTIVDQLAAFLASLPEAFATLDGWVISLGLSATVTEDLLAFIDDIEEAFASFDYSSLVAPIVSGLFALLGAFFSLLVLPFFMFFVLAGAPTIHRSIRTALPPPWRGDAMVVLRILLDSFWTYFKAEAIVMVILGTMTYLGLMFLSVTVDPAFAEVALLLAFIAALSELIPNLGPWIAAIPAVLFSLTISPTAVVATVILYLILMFIEGQVLVPKIEGGAFSFHPALVLFLVVAGIALMGILGAILVLPVTATVWRSSRYGFRRASGQIPPAPADGPYTDEWPPPELSEPVEMTASSA